MLAVAGYKDRYERDRMMDEYGLNEYVVVLGGEKQGKFVEFADALQICRDFKERLLGLDAVLHQAKILSHEQPQLEVSFSFCCITALSHTSSPSSRAGSRRRP